MTLAIAGKCIAGIKWSKIRTFIDHDELARWYENRASKLLAMAEKHEKLLQHYEYKSYLYGRHGQDFQSHEIALVQKYKRQAEKAAKAASHHRAASELAKRKYAASGASYSINARQPRINMTR
jgi:hypothetical protein